MATAHQIKQLEKRLREYRKKFLTKKQNLELDESGTRLMVNDFLTDVLGYLQLEEVKTEYNIKGTYADYVVQLARKKHFVIEVKSIQIDLDHRHLRQSTGYAANEGIDWIVLFNGKQVKLFRVLFNKPISVHQVFEFDLGNLSTMKTASEHLIYLTKASAAKNELETYWKRFNALTPTNLVKNLYTKDVTNAVRRKIRATSGFNFEQTDILDALHELVVNECKATKPKTLK